MADMNRYLNLAGLEIYDEKIKGVITAGDEAAKAYADSLAPNYDAVGTAQTKADAALESAKEYTDALANGQVNTNKEAIAGIVADYLKAADKTELEGKITAVDGKADKNAEDIAAINNETTGILALAKADATEKANAVQGNVDELAEYVGTIPEGATATDIVGYVQEKTAGIATDAALGELQAAVDAVEADVEVIKGDYLKSSDKTELEGKISTAQSAAEGAQGAVDALSGTHATDKAALEAAIALKADQTALNAVSDVANAAVKQSDYDAKVEALEAEDSRIVGLVEAEATKAREEEGKLDARLVEVEAFFKLAEGESLDTALDTLVEIQGYITGEGAAADQMVLDIAANKKAIEDHVATDHDFASADAALKSELEGKINLKADASVVEGIDGRLGTAEGKITTVEGKVSTLEGQMTEVQGAVATKAEAQALADAVSALEGADSALSGRLDDVEAILGDGEGSVSEQIADAKEEVLAAAAEDAQDKADAAEEAAKGHADSLNSAMNTRVEALEAIDHEHANKAELDLIASGDKAKWDAAEAKAHEHANKAELDLIVSGDKAKWDAAEGNAKTYADGLNSAMTTKVDGIDARVTQNTTDIATKADADDLAELAQTHATDKAALEAKDAELAAAIAKFTAITEDEISALFA